MRNEAKMIWEAELQKIIFQIWNWTDSAVKTEGGAW